jgi:hypothetical protein
MAKVVKDPEFAAVSALPGPARYAHFIGQVADWEEVWGLRGSGGWVLAADDDGRQLMPIWPHARYAEACAVGEWAVASWPDPRWARDSRVPRARRGRYTCKRRALSCRPVRGFGSVRVVRGTRDRCDKEPRTK